MGGIGIAAQAVKLIKTIKSESIVFMYRTKN
jgi:hypothetical protein